MKTARILLAALALASLAACGTESITGPAVPAAARYETTPDGDADDTVSGTPSGDTVQTCTGTIVTTTDAHGNTVVTCVTLDRGPALGSGS